MYRLSHYDNYKAIINTLYVLCAFRKNGLKLKKISEIIIRFGQQGGLT